MLHSHYPLRIVGSKHAFTALGLFIALAYPCQSTEIEAGAWAIQTGQSRGKPLEALLNKELKSNDRNFPYRAILTISYLKPAADGLPQGEEKSMLKSIESQLNDLITKNRTGKLAAIETHCSQSKFLFYVTNKMIARQAKEALNIPPPYKITMTVRKDSSWSYWRKIKSRFDY